ncbi:MAG TPA: CPBP family glutamic-type intramembrane protease [Pyrinomonadaceae bacterium]|nr:CPBP family glutamic-type intramembrane protease [Pyrinomonadaceae bacterium]
MPNGSTDGVPTEQPRRFSWRVLWLLLAACLAGAAAGIPLFLEIFLPVIQSGPPPPMPLPLLVAIGVVQNLLVFAVAIGLGLLLARKMGLPGAPLLEAYLYGEEPPVRLRDSLKYGVVVGIAVGIILLFIIIPAAPHLPGLPFVSAARVALWKRVLICFYGGIDEEVLTRLFLLTLLAWLGVRIFQRNKAQLAPATFWVANIIVAILFGLGHLPSAAMVMHITPTVVVLALVLNGIAAIPFGCLYWKRGLESAMIAHFCADFVIYVVGVAFLRV